MSMQTWAEKEIEIACKLEREASGVKNNDWDYGCACYESALKAYKSLMGDGHSGFSISMTKHILNRLIDGKPLTPIEDTEDVWNVITNRNRLHGEEVIYQCKRMGALFKSVYADGTVKYRDIDRCYGIDINNPDSNTFSTGLVTKIIDEMFPITMPYHPAGKPIAVYCEDFLTNKNNGDFDTRGVFHAIKDDKKIEINRFFKESKAGWDEINEAEYNERKAVKIV